MIAFIFAAALVAQGRSGLSGRMDLGYNVVTVTQTVTIPCFIETDPPMAVLDLANRIGFHKADYGLQAWTDFPLSNISFLVSVLKENVHFEQNYITNLTYPNLTNSFDNQGGDLIHGPLGHMGNFVATNFVTGHGIIFQVQTALTNVSLPALARLYAIEIWESTALPSLSFPVLTNLVGITASGNTVMTNFSAPLLLPGRWLADNIPISFNFTNCALTATAVNHILARCVANPGCTNGTLNLAGGTSAAPTGQGVTDKNTLVARGVTVFTN